MIRLLLLVYSKPMIWGLTRSVLPLRTMDATRIDKFIWAVRLFKTRSLGAKAVKAGQVLVNGFSAKPAQEVKVGDLIKVKFNPIWRTYEIVQLLKNRVGAKLVSEYITECTPHQELEKLEIMKQMPGFDRPKGAGRPTKKERRNLDEHRRG